MKNLYIIFILCLYNYFGKCEELINPKDVARPFHSTNHTALHSDGNASTHKEQLSHSLSHRASIPEDLIHPYVISGQFHKKILLLVNHTSEFIIEYSYNSFLLDNRALRITVDSPTSLESHPVLVVVRQQKEVLSWELPLEPPPNNLLLFDYRKVARTMCPLKLRKMGDFNGLDKKQRLFIDVSTSSQTSVNFTASVEIIEDFLLPLNDPIMFAVNPAQPRYYRFKYPEHVDMVLVKVTSHDDYCAMVSIQNVTCPVFDLEKTIKYSNFYQTMTYKAGITVRKENYPHGFYAVVIIMSNDEACLSTYQDFLIQREKIVTLTIEEKITKIEYIAAILAGALFCGFFFVVTIILGCLESIRSTRQQSMLSDSYLQTAVEGQSENTSTTLDITDEPVRIIERTDIDSYIDSYNSSSINEGSYDRLQDTSTDRNVVRMKANIYLSDLAHNDVNVLRKKSDLFLGGLLTIAIFYGVPVVQLVITYQNILDETGNLDICYYNFWCAHPVGPLSDFNHIYSNIAYILFGILFIAVCYRRLHRHKKASLKDDRIDRYFGIPQHFGLFFSMGVALITEGLFSASYHICPNYSNFQFDTAFMYVIAVLCMIKIYQTRHPDINASASSTYLALALVVFLGVVGVLGGSQYFWIFFTVIHLSCCVYLSTQIYYMGRFKLDLMVHRRIFAWCRLESRNWRHILIPLYIDRMVLLILANAANLGLSIYAALSEQKDFASFLLVIFMTNLMLYMTFYIIMKLRHGESIPFTARIYMLLCATAWALAANFFLRPKTTWAVTPAQSRQLNDDCALLDFYDSHDIWHFLSAAAMFFGFMLLLTLDDDLAFTPRNKIPVF